MKFNLKKCFGALVACLSLLPVLAFAQSSDLAENLDACKAGRDTCERSRLTPSEATDVVLAAHVRNVVNCRHGYDPCDRSKLTEPEMIALAVADHQRNVSDCTDGMQSCNPSKLTSSEAHAMAAAGRQRNLTACKEGWGACDRTKLSPSETEDVNIARRQLNASDCENGAGLCVVRLYTGHPDLTYKLSGMLTLQVDHDEVRTTSISKFAAIEVFGRNHEKHQISCKSEPWRGSRPCLRPED
jgi:hypothetical protein